MIIRTATVLAVSLAAASLAATPSAQAAVTVLGDQLGYECSVLALAGYADDKAIETCTQALPSSGLSVRDRAGTYVNRGVIQLRRKAYRNAHADFDAAIALDPTLGEAVVNRGAAFVAQRRFAEGIAEITRGLALGANEPEKAYYNRALAHEQLGDFKAAYLDYQAALKLKPGWSDPERSLTRFVVNTQ